MTALNKQALRQLATDAHELGIIKRYTKGIEANKRFAAIVTPLTVLALLDELEKERGYASTYEAEKWHYHGLAESEGERADRAEKALEAAETDAEWMRKRIEELATAREESEGIRVKWFQTAKELGEKLEAAERRIAELEAREVVLPKRLSPEGYHIDEAYMVDDAEGEYLDRDEVIGAIRAAGIGVKGE